MTATANPVCPHCNTQMVPKLFCGYYDKFAFWACECAKIPGSTIAAGAYSGGYEDGESAADVPVTREEIIASCLKAEAEERLYHPEHFIEESA